MTTNAHVSGLHISPTHTLSKNTIDSIELIEGVGIKGDAHAGRLVKHRSRVRQDPTQPNLRQVHLIHGELHDHLIQQGFDVKPGQMGENITTRGIDLLGLSKGTLLRIGSVELEVTGLRNPCHQLNSVLPGLLDMVVFREGDKLVRLAGIMTIVTSGGTIRTKDTITAAPPEGPHIELDRV